MLIIDLFAIFTGVEKSILPKLNFIEGETDIQQLTSYLESGNYVIEISAINPNESPEFLCPLNQEVTITKMDCLIKRFR